MKRARGKISTLVVGLDFYPTSSPFLKSFRSVLRVGTAFRGGTFHPKLYLFEDGSRCCCIIGSSNFTPGGFGDNAEVNICIESRTSDPFFRQAQTFIEEQEKQSEPISTKFHTSESAKAGARAKKERETAGDGGVEFTP